MGFWAVTYLKDSSGFNSSGGGGTHSSVITTCMGDVKLEWRLEFNHLIRPIVLTINKQNDMRDINGFIKIIFFNCKIYN